MMDREVKFKYLYTNGKNWITRVFTLEEIVSGDPWEVLSDSPFIGSKHYKHVGQVQWTGFKDKNGKEIFEGDIRTFKGGIGVIVWEDAVFAIKSPGSEAVDWEHSSVFIDSDLLGNIYENPELLQP